MIKSSNSDQHYGQPSQRILRNVGKTIKVQVTHRQASQAQPIQSEHHQLHVHN